MQFCFGNLRREGISMLLDALEKLLDTLQHRFSRQGTQTQVFQLALRVGIWHYHDAHFWGAMLNLERCGGLGQAHVAQNIAEALESALRDWRRRRG
jgi:hypothetical protein